LPSNDHPVSHLTQRLFLHYLEKFLAWGYEKHYELPCRVLAEIKFSALMHYSLKIWDLVETIIIFTQ